jgi:hypothetical protein
MKIGLANLTYNMKRMIWLTADLQQHNHPATSIGKPDRADEAT